jgi:hypothetical protein
MNEAHSMHERCMHSKFQFGISEAKKKKHLGDPDRDTKFDINETGCQVMDCTRMNQDTVR